MWEEILIQKESNNSNTKQEKQLVYPTLKIELLDKWKPIKGRFYLRWQNLQTLETVEGRTGLDSESHIKEVVERCNQNEKGWNFWYERC